MTKLEWPLRAAILLYCVWVLGSLIAFGGGALGWW